MFCSCFSIQGGENLSSNEALISSANMAAKSGNHDSALIALNSVIAKDPTLARAYKLRGHVHYARGDYKQAFYDLDQVIALSPNSANAYADRAIVNSMLNRHGAALSDIEYALTLSPRSEFCKAVRNRILESASGEK